MRAPGRSWFYDPMGTLIFSGTPKDAQMVAEVRGIGRGISDAEIEEIGYMIAACPDAIEACTEASKVIRMLLLRVHPDKYPEATQAAYKALRKINAVFSKAEGEKEPE